MRLFCLQSIFISSWGKNIRKKYSKKQLIAVQSRVIALCHVFHSCTSKKLRSHTAVHSLLLACFPLHISEMFDSCRSKHFIRIFNLIDECFGFITFWANCLKKEAVLSSVLWAFLVRNDDRKRSWNAVMVHSIHQVVKNRPWRELTGKKISFSVEWWWRLGATCYIYFRIPTSVARCTLSLMYKPMKGEC